MSSANPTRASGRAGKEIKHRLPPLKRPGADVIKVLRLASANKLPNLTEHGLMTPAINEYVLQWAASYLAGYDQEHALSRLQEVARAYKEATR